MTLLKTLRARFALWTMSLLLAALVLFGLLVYISMSRILIIAVDDKLKLAAVQLNAEAEVSGGEIMFVENLAEYVQSANLAGEGFSVRIFNLGGDLLQAEGRHLNLPPPQLERLVNSAVWYQITYLDPENDERVRLYTAPILDEAKMVGILQVAQSLGSVRRSLNRLAASLLIGGPLIMLVAGIGGYFLAARALAPISTITDTARHLSANDLSARLNLAETDDEVGRLAATFDLMLARLDHAFRRERQFIADASHELRTPLAAIKTIVDGTLARPRTAPEYEEALVDLRSEADQMKAMAEGLLDLARHDAMDKSVPFESIDLAMMLKDLIESVRPVAEEKQIQLVDKVSTAPCTMQGESDGLIRLFLNLLDNAIKYTDVGSITVTLKPPTQETLLVTIRDTGPGIASDALPYIFDRFYQVDPARSRRGVGLGLPIAQRLAELHGGQITVKSEERVGTTFMVRLARHRA